MDYKAVALGPVPTGQPPQRSFVRLHRSRISYINSSTNLWIQTPFVAVKAVMILVHHEKTRRSTVEIDEKLRCLEDLCVNLAQRTQFRSEKVERSGPGHNQLPEDSHYRTCQPTRGRFSILNELTSGRLAGTMWAAVQFSGGSPVRMHHPSRLAIRKRNSLWDVKEIRQCISVPFPVA